MITTKFRKVLVASALVVGSTAALPPVAFAQDMGFYAGAGIGKAKFKDACADPELTEVGFVGSCDDKDTAWKIFGGYQFNRNLGVELGYTDLGEATLTGTAMGLPVSAKTKAKGFELLGVGTFPINEQFAVYGKAGFFRWDVDASATVGGVTEAIGAKGTDFTFGLGLKYNFTKNLAARLEWQRYNDVGDENTTGKSKVNVIGVGVVVKF